MRHHAWWSVCLVVGCASEHGSPSPQPGMQPGTCATTVSLVGSTSAIPTPVTGLALDATGVNVCAHLDATQLSRAHFAALTDQRAGTSSGLEATLEGADHTTIVEAWDVSVGETSPQTFLNVEWAPPAGQVTDVVIWLRAPAAPAATSLALDLFDPLE